MSNHIIRSAQSRTLPALGGKGAAVAVAPLARRLPASGPFRSLRTVELKIPAFQPNDNTTLNGQSIGESIACRAAAVGAAAGNLRPIKVPPRGFRRHISRTLYRY